MSETAQPTPIADGIKRLTEVIRLAEAREHQLKWVIAQFMHRYNLEEVSFIENDRKFELTFDNDRRTVGRNAVIIKCKELPKPDETPDTARSEPLN